MRNLALALVAAAALAAPGLSQAAVYKVGHCQVTVPDGWVTSKTRIARPDKKVWASLLEAPTANEIVSVEKSMGVAVVSDGPGLTLMAQTASYGGLTNKQYHAITKTTPACDADVAFPAGPDDALGKQIALSVKVVK